MKSKVYYKKCKVGTIECYENDTILEDNYLIDGLRHREDGPAYICFDKTNESTYEAYFVNNILHRIDGPAVARYYKDGRIEDAKYYIDGVEYDELQYLVKISNMKKI